MKGKRFFIEQSLKAFLTLGLIAVFAFAISKEFRSLKGKLPGKLSLSQLVWGTQKVEDKIKLVNINHLRPSLELWASFFKTRQRPAGRYLEENVKYYEKIAEYGMAKEDVYHMLGLCYYFLGQEERAIVSYGKALALNPAFFWSRHNLGLILFRRAQYKAATDILKDTVTLEPRLTMQKIAGSRVYGEIIRSIGEFNYPISESLQDGYRDCYQIIVLSCYRMKNFQETFRWAQAAISLNLDSDGFFSYYAGAAAYELKEYSQGVSFLEESLKKQPQDPETFLYLGLSKQALGEKDAAAADLLRAKFLQKTKSPSTSPAEEMELKIF
jgi:tetratricopeptide (TPR) repeat protein